MRTLAIMLLLLVCVQGCGRKGALRLTPPQSETPTVSDQTEPKKQP